MKQPDVSIIILEGLKEKMDSQLGSKLKKPKKEEPKKKGLALRLDELKK